MKRMKVFLTGLAIAAIMISVGNPVAASPGVAKAQNVYQVKDHAAVFVTCSMEIEKIAVIRFTELHGPDYLQSLAYRVKDADKDPLVESVYFVMNKATFSGKIPIEMINVIQRNTRKIYGIFQPGLPGDTGGLARLSYYIKPDDLFYRDEHLHSLCAETTDPPNTTV